MEIDLENEEVTKKEAVELTENFVEQVLMEEEWFREIDEGNEYNLLIFTGSVVQGKTDGLSDLDLFLLSPLEVQEKHDLPPVSEYEYKGLPVEVSHVTSEKLKSDQDTKKHIYWWKDTEIIRCKNEKYKQILRNAGSYTEEEKREELWTLMVLYELNLIDMEKLVRREDELSFELNFQDCLKHFCKFMLLLKDISKRFKWYGRMMEKHHPEVFEEIEEIRNREDMESRLEGLKELRKHFRQNLQEYGFEEDEINNWHKNNLTKLKFQKY